MGGEPMENRGARKAKPGKGVVTKLFGVHGQSGERIDLFQNRLTLSAFFIFA